MTKDRVFRQPRRQIVDFAFDEMVAKVFPDMIRRSVPGYELVLPMTGLLAARHIAGRKAVLVYDLGCSLGATSAAILHAVEALGEPPAELYIRAVDNSEAMLDQAGRICTDQRVQFIEADILTLALAPCQVVTLNWALQFLPPPERLDLLRRIRTALAEDGVLLVAEKVHFEDAEQQAFCDAAHLDFKRANGYSELEISQKRTALEQVLVTDSIDAHLNRFEAAGFRHARLWFQCLNWAAFIAYP